jgi:chaperonin GroES
MLKPLGFTVLIKPEEVETMSKGGIVMATDNQIDRIRRASICGIVHAVGPTAYMREEFGNTPWVKVGDKVLFAKYAGQELMDPESGEIFLLIADEDVRCKYE